MNETMSNITEEQKKKTLEASLFQLSTEQPFYAGVLQEIEIKYDSELPTLYIKFDTEKNQYILGINPDFFCNLSLTERVALLKHEVLHFTHGHLFRFPSLGLMDNIKLWLVAADIAINQYITGLPQGFMDVKMFKTKTGEEFPTFQTMEVYHKLLKELMNQEDKEKQQEFEQVLGEGKQDDHPWDVMDEQQKLKAMLSAKKVFERTIEKTKFGFDSSLEVLKDVLKYIEEQINAIDYKRILQQTIKKKASSTDRKHSWYRMNKRYYEKAPGTKVGDTPKLSMIIDTSGSISVKELNQFLRVVDGFLKVGSRNCFLSFFHTNVYKTMKYKRGQVIDAESLESGGTSITPVVKHMNDSKADLNIVLTDGYFEHSTVKPNGYTEIVWVIAKGGDINHPMKGTGKTIPLVGLTE